uniref:substrate-binding domain-containing protein n=1 Tax=Aneurinibacillus thermoaerophilus TaxID=143495 RepID=UPI002E1C3A7A|nr:substrate-binding domain-containing protein [Aneurinibacillus thermoaerophilus]MED0764863.1 substrate-binding domain-containing protein [Aneurinibacillus thermoaerophilus]
MSNISYTTEEIANILKVSKLTVYDLIKKGEIRAYRVGRQMRVDAQDLETYKAKAKGEIYPPPHSSQPTSSLVSEKNTALHSPSPSRPIIISGQDLSLDILVKHLEKRSSLYRPLRSYTGSLNGLISMYKGEADIVSTHLWDGDTGEYNIPYIKKLLVGHRFLVVNLVSRWAGFYVKKGNPKQIQTWEDLTRPTIKIVNREKGSGIRVLLDEQLRLRQIIGQNIKGYTVEESSHLGVAGAIANGDADVGIGSEKAASIVGVDFVPLIKERYDLVILKIPENEPFIEILCDTLHSPSFKNDMKAIGGYELSETGKIIYETI